MFPNLTQDFRHATRTLRRNGAFTASAVVILAAGIAASTGLFAVVDAMVLHPLPYAAADRLARVRVVPSSGSPRLASVTAAEFLEVRRSPTLDGAYIKDSFTKTLSATPFPESVWTEYYTGNALTMLGIQPAAGRVFSEAEVPVGSEPPRVAVLTYRFWQRHFGGQPNALGQTLRLDGEPFTVIGVLSADYALDLTDIVLPFPMTSDATATWPVVVRVREGVSLAAAAADLQRLFDNFARIRPDAFPRGFRVELRRLIDEERGAAYVPILGVLFAAAGLLLLLGCASVTILQLARGRHRVHEMAVRHALGADRSRLAGLLILETLLLTFASASIAVLLVRVALPSLLDAVPGAISQRAGRIVVGPTAIVFASMVTSLAAAVAGIWPALAVSRAPGHALHQASALRTAADTSRLGSGALIATQVAIAVVLLAGTGASIRALLDLYRAPIGYDPDRITLAQIYLPIGRYTIWPQRVALYERLRAEVARTAGVERSTLSLIPTGPPPSSGMATRIDADGLRDGDREVLTHSVASDYFATLRMPLVRGRTWSVSDDERAEPVAVINETMARQLWPGGEAIGKRVRDRSLVERHPQWVLTAPGRDGWFEIIGVVRDAPNRGLREPVAPAMYYPYTAALSDVALLLVRTAGNPAAAERALRVAVSQADAELPIIRFISPEAFLRRPEGRFVAVVLFGFAAMALLLASFGLFSVASYSVARRTREFGIRIALGATPNAVRIAALQSIVIAVVAGLAVGGTLSITLNSVLARWSIHGIDDPVVLAGVLGTLVVSLLAATQIPVRRAIAIDPSVALNSE